MGINLGSIQPIGDNTSHNLNTDFSSLGYTMPHSFDWNSRRLIREFSGEISPQEILKSNFELQNHPLFEDIDYIVNDFTQVTALVINEDHAKIYASTDDIISDTKGPLKIAIVAIEDAHITLAESYKKDMQNKHFQCEIFPTTEDAIKWGEA